MAVFESSETESADWAVRPVVLEAGVVPPTRNYQTPDPACPVNVVSGEPLTGRPATAIAVNVCTTGQAVAVVIAGA